MRSDMAKVIVERPRWGSSLRGRKKGYRRSQQRTGLENLPRNESMAGRWRGRSKHFSEHLSPMERFLWSNIGRPWNKVHQELCENVDFGNIVQKHVMTHVYDYVARYVEERDGIPVDAEGYGYRFGRPLREGQMYVCPRTGILRVVRRKQSSGAPRRVCKSSTCQFHFRDGGWWEVQVRPLPAVKGEQWDVWLERSVAKIAVRQRESAYGGKLWAISKRLLSQSETRALLKSIRVAK